MARSYRYIDENDESLAARAKALFFHVLGDLGLLARAQAVGYVVHRFGVAMLIASFVWAGWILWKQYEVTE